MNTTVTPEPADHHQYSWVMFYRETVEFFVSAVKYYEDLLAAETKHIDADPHLSAFLTEDVRREFKIGRSHAEATRVREWLEHRLAERPNSFDVDISLSHGTTRYLKSVGLLYLGFLKQRRNALSRSPNVTSNLLSAIDRRITTQEEALHTQGIFVRASLVPLLVEQELPSELPVPAAPAAETFIAGAVRPKAVVIRSIELLDTELRDRCLDLFNQFEESGQSERHDTVVTEATRILENRLRILTRSTDGAIGNELVARAFAGTKPLIRVSEVVAEQEAVHLLFRGAFGFIRNRVHHKLLSDLAPERVLQILGLIDYLISVANTALPAEEGDR